MCTFENYIIYIHDSSVITKFCITQRLLILRSLQSGGTFVSMMLILSIVFISEVESLRCRCSTHNCPGDHLNETCTTEGHCYKKVEPGVDDSYELITYGCLPPKEKTRMQCNTPDHVHKKQLSMECCRNADMCNTLLQPSLPTTPSPTTGTGLLPF